MDRIIVGPEIEQYLDRITPPRDPVVAAMEERARRDGFPIVGPQVGRLLFVLARAAGACRVFEMGSGFGYSTMFFARAVGPAGLVVHTDGSAENSRDARAYLERADLAAQVRFLTGDARDLLRAEDTSPQNAYDIVFCDIDKDGYPDVPEIALPRLRPGGLLIFDNTLWYGRVCDDEGATADEDTAAVQRVNRILQERADVVTSILPLRDGVSVSVKI